MWNQVIRGDSQLVLATWVLIKSRCEVFAAIVFVLWNQIFLFDFGLGLNVG